MNVGVSFLLHKKNILKGNRFITFISAQLFKRTPEPFNSIRLIQISFNQYPDVCNYSAQLFGYRAEVL